VHGNGGLHRRRAPRRHPHAARRLLFNDKNEEAVAGEAATGVAGPAGDRAEPGPAPRDAEQHRRAVAAGLGRPVRPRVEAVAVRRVHGVRDGARREQAGVRPRRAGAEAAPVPAADPGPPEHPRARRRRLPPRARHHDAVPQARHAAAVRGHDRRRGDAAPRRRGGGAPGRRRAAADEAAHVRHHRDAALRPRARRRQGAARRGVRRDAGGHVVGAAGPAVHGVPQEPQGEREGAAGARGDARGEEGQAGAGARRRRPTTS